eukprot:COSAG04_NODE_1448_length_6700_cov_27.687472_1_plen_289_part_10
MSRRQRRPAPHSWDGGGIRGRAISPGASYDRERSGAGSDSLFRSFASSVSELESTATLGAAAPEEEAAGDGAAGGDGVVRELIQELKDTQQMVQQMEQRMEEQEGQVQAARRRAAELEEQLEAERLPLLQADAQRSVLEEKLKEATTRQGELRRQRDREKRDREKLYQQLKVLRADNKREMERAAREDEQRRASPKAAAAAAVAPADGDENRASADAPKISRRSVNGAVRTSHSRSDKALGELKRQVETLSRANKAMKKDIATLHQEQKDSADTDGQAKRLRAEIAELE